MEEHPYTRYLEGQDPVVVVAETPGRLRKLLAHLPAEQINATPAPGKWSLREIMAHLADCEIAWSYRLRQVLSQPGLPLQAFDQDQWAERYAAYDFVSAQAMFEALRSWNLLLLSTVTEEDKAKATEHPKFGRFTFGSLVGTIAGHDLHHLHLLERLLAPTA